MSIEQDVQQLRILVAELTRRIYRLEQKIGVEPGGGVEPPRAEAVQPIPPKPEPPMPVIPLRQAEAPPIPQFGQRPRVATAGTDELEQRIGSQWMNRIGIVAVLIGA